MLNRIKIDNIFAHRSTDIRFNTGLTRLHGANEAGKSQVFEMVRFALFGTKALRTSASDYAGGSVTLTFNDDYVVHRTTGNATLHKGDQLIARSTTAVNKKIIELIGYGLKTFDNVNSIQQDEVQKLTKLKAEDRKKFLDELIGAAQIDELIAEYKAIGQIEAATVEGLKNSVIRIEEPKEPSVDSLEAIESQLDTKSAERADLRLQEKIIEALSREVESIVGLPDSMADKTIEELETLLDQARQLDAATKEARIGYPMIARLYDMGAREISVSELKHDVAAVLASRSVRKPAYTLDEVEEYRRKHQSNDAHIEVLRLRAELETYTRCPGFEKEHEETVAKINLLLPSARPYTSLPSVEALEEAVGDNQKYGVAALALKRVKSPYAQAFSEAVEFDQKIYDKIIAILNNPVPDIIGIYSSINAKKERARLKEKENQLEIEKKKLDPLVIAKIDTDISALREARSIRQRYDTELRYYVDAMKKNQDVEKKLVEKKEQQAETMKVVKALQGFKYYINTYFLPSVSKAASAMLVTMTNGKRKKITITDKFEITVDGKQVEAMSGSTKAIINIALRFALQFVLTKNSFSVFMADEVDGAMDEDRAKYLNECLGNMVEHIKQVIVISHKDIVATHNIKL